MYIRNPQTSEQNLRPNVTENHYAQLFFVVGHISVKMLAFVEQIEINMKKQMSEAGKKQQEQDKQNPDP